MKGSAGESENYVHKGRIKVPYTWWVGETGSRFFVALRDEKKILGTYCGKCRMTFLPPRKACGRCFNTDMEWREVGPRGTLVSFTVPRYREPIHPDEETFAFALVKLDGADTALAHIVCDFHAGELRTGMPVEARFREDRKGNILDIRCFSPVR